MSRAGRAAKVGSDRVASQVEPDVYEWEIGRFRFIWTSKGMHPLYFADNGPQELIYYPQGLQMAGMFAEGFARGILHNEGEII